MDLRGHTSQWRVGRGKKKGRGRKGEGTNGKGKGGERKGGGKVASWLWGLGFSSLMCCVTNKLSTRNRLLIMSATKTVHIMPNVDTSTCKDVNNTGYHQQIITITAYCQHNNNNCLAVWWLWLIWLAVWQLRLTICNLQVDSLLTAMLWADWPRQYYIKCGQSLKILVSCLPFLTRHPIGQQWLRSLACRNNIIMVQFQFSVGPHHNTLISCV